MERAEHKPESQSLDDLASRMSSYRERATAARRLADAITDKRATKELVAHAEEFEKKAEEIATEIVLLAHIRENRDREDAASAPAPSPTREKHR
jgi:hypothetical protein